MIYAHRSASLLLLLTTTALLTSCGKEEATPEVKEEATLSRSLVYDPATTSKAPFVTSYSAANTKTSARITPESSTVPTDLLQLSLSGDGPDASDSLHITLPVFKLKPNWVGTYTLSQSGADGSTAYTFHNKKSTPTYYALFYSSIGSITITSYDATTRHVSGTYSLAMPRAVDFSDISSVSGPIQTVFGKLTLTGSFSRLPIAP
jgi:hypothetical protein